jgi:hypothetical protein
VLSSFAMGRQSSLVVDSGHDGTVGEHAPSSCRLWRLMHTLTGSTPAMPVNVRLDSVACRA